MLYLLLKEKAAIMVEFGYDMSYQNRLYTRIEFRLSMHIGICHPDQNATGESL